MRWIIREARGGCCHEKRGGSPPFAAGSEGRRSGKQIEQAASGAACWSRRDAGSYAGAFVGAGRPLVTSASFPAAATAAGILAAGLMLGARTRMFASHRSVRQVQSLLGQHRAKQRQGLLDRIAGLWHDGGERDARLIPAQREFDPDRSHFGWRDRDFRALEAADQAFADLGREVVRKRGVVDWPGVDECCRRYAGCDSDLRGSARRDAGEHAAEGYDHRAICCCRAARLPHRLDALQHAGSRTEGVGASTCDVGGAWCARHRHSPFSARRQCRARRQLRAARRSLPKGDGRVGRRCWRQGWHGQAADVARTGAGL